MLCEKCGGELDDFLGLCPVCDIDTIHEWSIEFNFDSPYEDEWEDEADDWDWMYPGEYHPSYIKYLDRCPHCHEGYMETGGDGNYCNVCGFFEPIS